jgi:hypothetical protein
MTTKRRDRCYSCGGPCTTPCTDNHGGQYLGCDRGCRFKTMEEIERMMNPKKNETAREILNRLSVLGGEGGTLVAFPFEALYQEIDLLLAEGTRLRNMAQAFDTWDRLNPPSDEADLQWARKLLDDALRPSR